MNPWAAVDDVLATAVTSGAVPGVVAVVGDRRGLLYEGSFGCANVHTQAPMTAGTMFRVASQAKLPTALLVLRLIEQGRLELGTAVGDVLPAFDMLPVLEGFDGDAPVLRPPQSRATVEQLLTHTSGLGYDIWDKKLKRYYQLTGQPALGTGRRTAFTAPLVNQPGTRFQYSMSMDWAGLVVEAVEGRPLDEVLQTRIFGPAGMVDTVCWMEGERRERAASVHIRDEQGNWAPTGADYYVSLAERPEFYAGGHSLYSTPRDYFRVQQALLNGGALDGVTLLGPEAVEGLFEDHLHGLDCGVIETADLGASLDVDLTGRKWSLGLLLDVSCVPGMRAPGTAGWAGGFNSFYWVDRENGIAAGLYTQTLPFWDQAIIDCYRDFEKQVYAVAT